MHGGSAIRMAMELDKHNLKNVKAIYKEMSDWIEENAKGRPWFDAERQKRQGTILSEVGKKLRKTMPFLADRTVPTEEKVLV